MSKHVVASLAALMLIAGSSAMAQESEKMKGPPNANGMSNSDSSGSMKSGDTGNSNGAASAKATGEDKK
jgi:hypothetical protein